MSRLKRQDSGFTLVELLVATAIALLLVGVTVALITSALKSEPRTSSRSSQIEAGRVMLENVTRELREGCKVEGSRPVDSGYRELSVFMDCTAGNPDYVYSCGGDGVADANDRCYREKIAADTSELMVSGLEVDSSGVWPVFILNADNYVEIQLRFPRAEAGDGEAVTLSDGVAMRNQ